MTNMKALAREVKALESQLANCVRCGTCQSVCPLFAQTRKESDVARGKLALLTGLIENIFSDPNGVDLRLNKCLLCGSCAAKCPSGVNVVDIFIRARAILAQYQGLSSSKKIIFKTMLANPSRFDALTAWAGRFQGLFTRPRRNAQGTSCARLISPLLHHRNFVPLAPAPFHKEAALKWKNSHTGAKKNRLKAAIFTGCLIDKVFPNVARAMCRVLDHHGVEIIIPQGQGCCGIPALASGDHDTFKRLVDHNLSLFQKEGCDVLVTACATCTATLKKLWPAVYPDAPSGIQAGLENLSAKTMDISQFIVEQAAPGAFFPKGAASKGGESVTYHDPCHLKKIFGRHRAPRQLLRAAGLDLKEMEGADKCCGMGGSFNIFHYELSASIGRLKARAIMDTGCTTLATSCPACMMQISDMLAKENAPIQVRHPVELYARSLAAGESD